MAPEGANITESSLLSYEHFFCCLLRMLRADNSATTAAAVVLLYRSPSSPLFTARANWHSPIDQLYLAAPLFSEIARCSELVEYKSPTLSLSSPHPRVWARAWVRTCVRAFACVCARVCGTMVLFSSHCSTQGDAQCVSDIGREQRGVVFQSNGTDKTQGRLQDHLSERNYRAEAKL